MEHTGGRAIGVARTVVNAILGLVCLHTRVRCRKSGSDDVVDVVPEFGAGTGFPAQTLAAGVAGNYAC